MTIAILLSAYNGERFLSEQINSILSQTNSDWCLYIRDDGSTDGTINIIKFYAEKYPRQIIKIEDNAGNLKSAGSFMYMLNNVYADYYMFCDQDDVWLPFKIEITLKKLGDLETKNKSKGILIFTDLSVVGHDLTLIDESMWTCNKINPENAKDFYKTTCATTVTGATLMFNNEIKKMVLPFPRVALMHDWWISLNAAHYGIVDYVNTTTMLYRQHGHNVLGVEKPAKNHYLKRLIFLTDTIKGNIKVLKMLNALPFEVSVIKFLTTKIITVINKSYLNK